MQAKTRTPAKALPWTDPEAASEPMPLDLPEWSELPDPFRDILLLFLRFAYTLDDAHTRCPRRECRLADACAVSFTDRGGCRGQPSERAEHWATGMWLARAADLVFHIPAPPANPAPEADAASREHRRPGPRAGREARRRAG